MQKLEQIVQVGACKSDTGKVTYIFVQGSCLGPLISFLLIWDLQGQNDDDIYKKPPNDQRSPIMTWKFASDSKLASLVRPQHVDADENDLHKAMNNAYLWAHNNNMFFNFSKFSSMSYEIKLTQREEVQKTLFYNDSNHYISNTNSELVRKQHVLSGKTKCC